MLEAGKQFGHYKIHSRIGAGGMGEVYLAEDTRLHRQVALKVLSEKIASDKDHLHRFEREAQTISALNHPNIMTVFEFGALGNIHFLASEFVKGETLSKRLNRENLLLSEKLELAVQIASALQAAHEVGIIHRDIKPENVMIREDGYVKVLDFGLAKPVELPPSGAEAKTGALFQTEGRVILGTAAYMSPEQASGGAADARTDTWSLGVVLYEMLTRRLPFTGETFIQIIFAILEKEPPPISVFVKDYPEEIERIIKKALMKNADERYQTAKDLLADLKALNQELDFRAKLESSSEWNKAAEYETQTFNAETIRENSSLPPTNLSENFPAIVGREKEIAEIKNLLAQKEVRLVTLTGIGGMGKTTLGRAASLVLLTEFADGVFFVELSAVTNTELVALTIAQPLGVMEAGGKPILELLKDYLRDKQMLLVIDNFEQVIEAAPQIAELLSAADRLKILITSRTLLRLSAEREFVVSPLAVPSEISHLSLDELSNYEAIKLFVKRARNAKSSFTLSEEIANSVAEICTRLDGLPLAIELAAARVKILSPHLILAKLENRLKLLTGGAEDLPARQQTMRGAIEWSYDLLNEDEKTVFRRLAVFAGGFTFEAAEAVVEGDDETMRPRDKGKKLEIDTDEIPPSHRLIVSSPQIDVLDGITSLADKSLLIAKEQSDGEMRFRMLEIVREYASESLEATNGAEAIRGSHAAYFLMLGEEAEPHLLAAQSVKWLNRLEEEHDNLRAALRWSLKNDVEIAARLAAALQLFWAFHSHLTEGRKWLKEALERSRFDIPAAVRFKLLLGLGISARRQGDYETARKAYEEALAVGRAANDARQIALSSRGLGTVAYQQGDFTTARKFFEEGLEISRNLDDKSDIAIALNLLGDLARTEGNNAAARPLFEEALAIVRQLGNKQAVSINLINLGFVVSDEADFAAAHSYFAEALATDQEFGNKIQITYSLDGFAALAAARGAWEYAAKLAGAAEQLREQIGFELEPADQRFRDAYTAELKTKMNEADFAKFYEQGRKLKPEEAITLCLEESKAKTEFNKTTTGEENHTTSPIEKTESIAENDTNQSSESLGAKPPQIDFQQTANKPRTFWRLLIISIISLLLFADVFIAYRYCTTNKQIKSIGVLPFVNESGNQDAERLSDGMTEMLIGSLSQIPKLNVKSQSSVFLYKGKYANA